MTRAASADGVLGRYGRTWDRVLGSHIHSTTCSTAAAGYWLGIGTIPAMCLRMGEQWPWWRLLGNMTSMSSIVGGVRHVVSLCIAPTMPVPRRPCKHWKTYWKALVVRLAQKRSQFSWSQILSTRHACGRGGRGRPGHPRHVERGARPQADHQLKTIHPPLVRRLPTGG